MVSLECLGGILGCLGRESSGSSASAECLEVSCCVGGNLKGPLLVEVSVKDGQGPSSLDPDNHNDLQKEARTMSETDDSLGVSIFLGFATSSINTIQTFKSLHYLQGTRG